MGEQDALDLGIGCGMLVDAETLAQVLGVSASMIYKLNSKHGMPKEARKHFDLPTCVQWFVNYKAEQQDDSAEGKDTRTALAMAQKERIDLDIAERKSQLLDRETVGGVVREMASIFSSGLEALSPRLASDLAGIEDQLTIQEKLDDECRSIRVTVAESIKNYAADYERGEHHRAAAEA